MSLKKKIKTSRYIRNSFLVVSIVLLLLDIFIFFRALGEPVTDLKVVYFIYFILCFTMLAFFIATLVNCIFRLQAKKKSKQKKEIEVSDNDKLKEEMESKSNQNIRSTKKVIKEKNLSDPRVEPRRKPRTMDMEHRVAEFTRESRESIDLLKELEDNSLSIDADVENLMNRINRKK